MEITPPPDDIVSSTPLWNGERSADGRPRVSNDTLALLRSATAEQAWSTMQAQGYLRQFCGGWRETHPGTITVGRALTAQFLPHRPDHDQVVVAAGRRAGHMEGDHQNTWVIERLENNDVMVVDIFGKVVEGTVIGDNLGTAVASRTGVGAIIDGGIRDLAGLTALEGVNFFHRGVDPTPIRDVTLAGVNIPIRIGGVTVLPGDITLGTPSGVTIIPAHLADEVAAASLDTARRDRFGKQRLIERRYTSADIDVAAWPREIEDDYQEWLSSAAELPGRTARS